MTTLPNGSNFFDFRSREMEAKLEFLSSEKIKKIPKKMHLNIFKTFNLPP